MGICAFYIQVNIKLLITWWIKCKSGFTISKNYQHLYKIGVLCKLKFNFQHKSQILHFPCNYKVFMLKFNKKKGDELYEATVNGNDIILKNAEYFSIEQTLTCGQAFRWNKIDDGAYEGIAFGKYLKLRQISDNIIFYNTTLQDFNNIWRNYFDLDRNYGAIISKIENSTVKKAATVANGIRILNQEPFETLCSFIFSQNNNIPRIKGIVERFCLNFGEKINNGYAFPNSSAVAALTVDDLAVLRSGFRAKYILDAANKVNSGEIDLACLTNLPIDAARQKLLTIYGVGNKVADCVLLYGLGHTEAFPKDVWIKRIMAEYNLNGMREEHDEFAGIYQQYLFYYIRNL